MTDVDITERLNGLVTLLNMVGIDGSDPQAVSNQQKKVKGGSKSGQSPASTATTSASSSSEAQLLELIRKLQQAQTESPEILEALKSPELRALAALASAGSAAKKEPEPEKKAAPALDDVFDDDDDNYPKIGPGYSDDISVVSDMSTPTVMTKQQVAEEEYYKEVNGGPGSLPPMNIALGGGPAAPSRPPMSIGGGAHYGIVPPPKKKNLVAQVGQGAAANRRAMAKTGGAAAQRRLNYQQAMAKLQSESSAKKKDPNYMENFSPKKVPKNTVPSPSSDTPDPSEFFPSIAADKKIKHPKKSSSKTRRGKTSLASQEMQDISFGDDDISPTPSQKKKASGLDWGGDASGWPSFDDSKSKDSKNSGSGDAFGASFGSSFGSGKSDPLKAPKSPRKKGKEENVKRFAEITITKDGTGGTPKALKAAKKDKDKDKKKKSRRASIGL